MDPSEQEQVPNSKIRVLLADVTEMVGEVVARQISWQPDMTLVGTVKGRIELLQTVDRDTDVLLLGVSKRDPPPGICSHLLAEYPYLRILVLANGGIHADLYWLGLHSKPVGDLSPESLIACIRDAFRLNATV